MIKEKDLVPGRVITTMKRVWGRGEPDRDVITAWLIIGFTSHVKRRHNAKQAPREGWHLLLLSFGGALQAVHITPSSLRQYKRLF